jgi:hypothetical protein
VSNLLNEREKTHGHYYNTATASQEIKNVMHNSINWPDLNVCQKESLELIALKISRILNGDQNEPDHWQDIAGYAKLVDRHDS